jgi:hypothetical protein
MTMTMDPYCFEARNLLRAQMASKGITLTQLSKLLSATGPHEGPRPLSAKINRGKFSVPFFLRCMKVIGMEGSFLLLPKVAEDSMASQLRTPSAKVPAKRGASKQQSPAKDKVGKGSATRKRKETSAVAG